MLGYRTFFPQGLLLGLMMSLTLGSDALAFDWKEHPCYAQAMIGRDSVINARLGLPAEHALGIVGFGEPRKSGDLYDSTELLKVMWSAYLWDDSPHEYSRKVFRECTLGEGQVSMINKPAE